MQTPGYVIDIPLIGAVGVELLGEVEVGWRIGLVPVRQNTDDRKRLRIEDHRLPNYVTIRSQPVLPKRESQHGQLTSARHILLLGKSPPKERLHAEHVEEAGGNMQCSHWLRPVTGAETKAHAAEIIGSDRLKCLAFSPRHESRNRYRRRIAVRVVTLNSHHLLGISKGQWTQKNAVDKRENRRVGSDPNRQRENRNHRKTGILEQDAAGMPDVSDEVPHVTGSRRNALRQVPPNRPLTFFLTYCDIKFTIATNLRRGEMRRFDLSPNTGGVFRHRPVHARRAFKPPQSEFRRAYVADQQACVPTWSYRMPFDSVGI